MPLIWSCDTLQLALLGIIIEMETYHQNLMTCMLRVSIDTKSLITGPVTLANLSAIHTRQTLADRHSIHMRHTLPVPMI